MKDHDQPNSASDAASKEEPARGGEQVNPKGDEQSDREARAHAEGSTESRPRGHTEDPDRTL